MRLRKLVDLLTNRRYERVTWDSYPLVKTPDGQYGYIIDVKEQAGDLIMVISFDARDMNN